MATHLSRYRSVVPAHVLARPADRLCVIVTREERHTPAEAMLQDVSPFGCRLAVAEAYCAGEPVSLKIGGAVVVSATVVWSDADTVACRFGQAMPKAVLRQLTIRP